MLLALFVVLVAVLLDLADAPQFDDGHRRVFHPSDCVGMGDVFRVVQVGFVVDDQVSLRAVNEGVFLILEDHAGEHRSTTTARHQVDKTFPARNKRAGRSVGDEEASPIHSGLKAKLAGGHDAGGDALRRAALQGLAGAECGQGEARHAVCGQVLRQGKRHLRLEFVHEVAECRNWRLLFFSGDDRFKVLC